MKSNWLALKVTFCIALLASACSCTAMPTATARVTDESGHPIAGASVIPSPIRPFGSNLSDAKGRVKIYQIDEGTVQFRIQAEGFEAKTIRFPGKGQSIQVTLKRR